MTTQSLPAVSVGLPVYNGERFLAGTLDSLLAQTLPDFELIISDNCSTDRTEELCRAYAARDSRVRYVRQARNLGASRNWNFVVSAAHGQYFKWASANDLCHPQLLAACVAGLREDPSRVLCYGRTQLIDDEGGPIGTYEHDLDIVDASASRRFIRACDEIRLNNAQSGVIRRDLLLRTRLERHYAHADIALMAELALLGGFHLLPQVLLLRRMGRQSATRYMSGAQIGAFLDPGNKGRRQRYVWLKHLDLLRVAAAAPVRADERWTAALHVLKSAYWQRSRLMREIVGAGD